MGEAHVDTVLATCVDRCAAACSLWTLTLDAAKHKDIPLWADDTGLRVAAHSMGIKTFGTLSILTIAHERQRIDTPMLDQITRELIREYAVDIPYDHSALLDIAAEQSWHPGPVAVILSRAATWTSGLSSLQLFRTAFRNSPDTGLVAWAYAALNGVRGMTSPDQRHKKLTVFTVITLSDEWMRPAHGAAFVAALNTLAPDEAASIVQEALKEIWTRLKGVYPTDHAVTVFLHIISQLDEPHRHYGAQLILG